MHVLFTGDLGWCCHQGHKCTSICGKLVEKTECFETSLGFSDGFCVTCRICIPTFHWHILQRVGFTICLLCTAEYNSICPCSGMHHQIAMAPSPAYRGQMQVSRVYQFITVSLDLHWRKSIEFHSTKQELYQVCHSLRSPYTLLTYATAFIQQPVDSHVTEQKVLNIRHLWRRQFVTGFFLSTCEIDWRTSTSIPSMIIIHSAKTWSFSLLCVLILSSFSRGQKVLPVFTEWTKKGHQ